MATVIGEVDYVQGYLKYGHYELKLSDAKLEEFSKLSDKEKKAMLRDEGELIVDEAEIEDVGGITSIEIYKE